MEKNDEVLSDGKIIQCDESNNAINFSNEKNFKSNQEIDILNQKKRYKYSFNIKKINNHNHHNFENDENLILRNCPNKRNYANIGNNIVLFNRFVLGPKIYLWLLILIMLGISSSWVILIYSIGNFYSKKVYNFLNIFHFLTQFFMLLSFLTEPGIIPRNCPDFKIKENENNENDNSNIINVDNKEKNQEEIPRIFIERKCKTCNILRPSGASHCRICDNCVMDFDHHCVFISNCVGKRNHKYFVLFLFFGLIFSVLAIFLIFIVIFYVFIIKFRETLLPLYKGNKWLLLLSLILLLFSSLASASPFLDFGCIIIPGLSGFVLFIYIWNKYVPKNDLTPPYYNPYIILVFIIAISFGVFDIANFFGQCYHIQRGFTIKQIMSINNKLNELSFKNPNKKINCNYIRRLSCKEKIKNIISFLFKKVDKSLIIPERDLIKN